MTDEVVQRRRGRPFRSFGPEGVKPPARACANGLRCAQCPKNSDGTFCAIQAKRVPPGALACPYGRVLIAARKQADRRAVHG